MYMFSPKPLPEPMLTYCQLHPKEQTSMKFEYIFIKENKFENVCIMPFGNMDVGLGQHWLRWHQAITWANVMLIYHQLGPMVII